VGNRICNRGHRRREGESYGGVGSRREIWDGHGFELGCVANELHLRGSGDYDGIRATRKGRIINRELERKHLVGKRVAHIQEKRAIASAAGVGLETAAFGAACNKKGNEKGRDNMDRALAHWGLRRVSAAINGLSSKA
jgi:hypothetical protein